MPAVCTCSPKGQLYPGLHQKKLVLAREMVVILYSAPHEVPPGVVSLGLPAQEKCGACVEGPERCHEDDLKAGVLLLRTQAKGAWLV